MHLFKAKAEAKAEAKGKIESIIDLLNLNKEPNLLDKYKIIFAKSFFNVAEKPITFEDKELYRQLNELEGEKITPVGELDYSQAKIPCSQDEYNVAYQRAKEAVENAFDKKYDKVGNKKQQLKVKIIDASKKSLLDSFNQIDENIGNRLAGFSNVVAVDRQVARVNSRLEGAKSVAQNQAKLLSAETLSLQSPKNAAKIQKLGLEEVVQNLSNRSVSINKRLTTQGIALDGNKTQSERETPSSSPKEPKASCLSGMFKAKTNFKTPDFVKSIYHRLRNGSGGSRGGQGR